MTEKVRLTIAALVTATFLGAVSAAGMLSHPQAPTVSSTSAAQIARPRQAPPSAIPASTSEQNIHD